jgi:hypothetical protein
MRIINEFEKICTFPEDFIVSLIDFSYLNELKNKNTKNPVQEVSK